MDVGLTVPIFFSGVSIAVPCHDWGIVLGLHSYSGRYVHSCSGIIRYICIPSSNWRLGCNCNGICRWFLYACTCSVGVSWLMLRSMLVYSMNGSSSVSYVDWNALGAFCGGLFPLISAASLSTPVISMSPIGQPLLSMKIN